MADSKLQNQKVFVTRKYFDEKKLLAKCFDLKTVNKIFSVTNKSLYSKIKPQVLSAIDFITSCTKNIFRY